MACCDSNWLGHALTTLPIRGRVGFGRKPRERAPCAAGGAKNQRIRAVDPSGGFLPAISSPRRR